MSPNPLEKIEIEVDSREQVPLLFNRMFRWFPHGFVKPVTSIVETIVCPMETGDYRLACAPDIAVAERKRDIFELYHNFLTKDRRRASASLARLSKCCKYPYLLIEGSPTAFVAAAAHRRFGPPSLDTAKVWDALSIAIAKLNLRLIWMGVTRTDNARRTMGDFLLRLMLRHALEQGAI